jgi:hypothetical protein
MGCGFYGIVTEIGNDVLEASLHISVSYGSCMAQNEKRTVGWRMLLTFQDV